MEEVASYRAIAELKHQNMVDNQTQFIIALSSTATVWIVNLLDAYFRFPQYANIGDGKYPIRYGFKKQSKQNLNFNFTLSL